MIRPIHYKIAIPLAVGAGLLTGTFLFGRAMLRKVEDRAEPRTACFVSPYEHPDTYHRHLEVIGGTVWACDDLDGRAFCYELKSVPGECGDMLKRLNEARLRDQTWERKAQKEEAEKDRKERDRRVSAMWDILETIEDVKSGKIQLKDAEKKYGKQATAEEAPPIHGGHEDAGQ